MLRFLILLIFSLPLPSWSSLVREDYSVLLISKFANPAGEKMQHKLAVSCLQRRDEICLELQFFWHQGDQVSPIGVIFNQEQASFILREMIYDEDWIDPIKSFGNVGYYSTKKCKSSVFGCVLKRAGMSLIIDVPTFAPQILAHLGSRYVTNKKLGKMYYKLQKFTEGEKDIKPIKSKKYFFMNAIKSIDFLTDSRLWQDYF